MKEQFDKIKEMMVKKEEKSQDKKKIENVVVFILILIITIIVINAILNDGDKKNVSNSNKELAGVSEETSISDITGTSEKEDLKNNLEGILCKINGVGKVKVLITYTESSQVVAMYNENTKETSTEEKDETGGIRTIKESDTQKDVIYEESSGQKKPITQKTIMPKIEGAIVTAQGASNIDVKTNIIQAVEAVTGLATHKIQVFEMEN